MSLERKHCQSDLTEEELEKALFIMGLENGKWSCFGTVAFLGCDYTGAKSYVEDRALARKILGLSIENCQSNRNFLFFKSLMEASPFGEMSMNQIATLIGKTINDSSGNMAKDLYDMNEIPMKHSSFNTPKAVEMEDLVDENGDHYSVFILAGPFLASNN